MVLKLTPNKLAVRAGVLFVEVGVCALLGYLVLRQFIVGTLADESITVSRQVIAAAADYFPDSARLQIRLAAIGLAETDGDDQAMAQAAAAAHRAVTLLPGSATPRLLLAKALEQSGNVTEAEEALRGAVAAAPFDPNLHWQLANLLVRLEKYDEARSEFRIAVTGDRTLLPAAFDLLWQLSDGNLDVLDDLTGGKATARLELAQFLMTKARPDAAAEIFNKIDRQERLSSSLADGSASFIDKMMTAGELEPAHRLWLDLLGVVEDAPLIWNGSFEADARPGLGQFDWNISRSEYALITTDESQKLTGARALRIDFAGRDTTKLTQEIRQLIILQPGARYRLECYAKAFGLVTPEGPRVVLTTRNSSQVVAASAPLDPDEADWQKLSVDFVAPADQSAFFITIQRVPKYSYDDPTKGTVWFDDFTLTETADLSGLKAGRRKN